MLKFFFQSGIRRVTRPGRSKGYKEYKWGRAGGSWSAEQFLKLDWSAERKRKNSSERGALSFSNFTNVFPISQSFHSRFLKKKERWKPTGARSAVRKYVGARSANAERRASESKGLSAERKLRKGGSAEQQNQKE